jgi:hypothetical protein
MQAQQKGKGRAEVLGRKAKVGGPGQPQCDDLPMMLTRDATCSLPTPTKNFSSKQPTLVLPQTSSTPLGCQC